MVDIPYHPKPPLGLMPKSEWDRLKLLERNTEILAAWARYARAKEPLPAEWLGELWANIDELDATRKFLESAVVRWRRSRSGSRSFGPTACLLRSGPSS